MKASGVCLECGQLKEGNLGCKIHCFDCGMETEVVSFGGHIHYKYGSWEKWKNSTSLRVTGYLPKDKIDSEMLDAVVRLNDGGLFTTSSCFGHNSRRAHISFDSVISKEQILKIINPRIKIILEDGFIKAFEPEKFSCYTLWFKQGDIPNLLIP